jgi:hypothetical protein
MNNTEVVTFTIDRNLSKGLPEWANYVKVIARQAHYILFTQIVHTGCDLSIY